MRTVNEIRADFPILSTKVHGRGLVYLDNGATMQLPRQVLDHIREHYEFCHANIHRGIHYLSEQSTAQVEQTRRHIADYVGARFPEEIIFTSGTTQSINLAARSFGERFLRPGELVVTTEMEHHSNLVPWQELCRRSGARLGVVPLTDRGELNMEVLKELLAQRPRLVAVTCVSNVLGTVNPVEEIVALAHQAGAAVLLDGAQAMRHRKFDMAALGCDFFCFSGHKLMAPTGIGVLYGRREWLEQMPPVIFGGGMVDNVELEGATYGALPFRFEAGTPNIAGIIGLEEAIGYLEREGLEEVAAWEDKLLRQIEAGLHAIPNVMVLGAPERRAGAVSFQLARAHCYDVAKLLDQMGIAVRSGHHCAQPLLRRFGLDGAVRVTPAFYNTEEEVRLLLQSIQKIDGVLRGTARK